MNLPYAAEADAELSVAELEVLEEAYTRASQSHVKIPIQIKFNYAWGLVRSRFRADQERGVSMFKEIMQDEGPERRRECMYYLALGYYRLGEYGLSRRYNQELLDAEPGNMQALSLQQLIHERVNREGLVGMALLGLVGGVVAVGGYAFAAVLKRKK